MKGLFSTRDAAKKLGVSLLTLRRHVSAKTVDVPPLQRVGGVSVRLWANRDIGKARFSLASNPAGRKNHECGTRRFLRVLLLRVRTDKLNKFTPLRG